MSVKIKDVEEKSLAKRLNIEPGMILNKINGNNIVDVLDYRFYETEPQLLLELTANEKIITVKAQKSRYSPLGLVFDTYLMDRERACKNKCIFCFIDQLPKGMRKSLYFKDDDSRLSFLFGNYITLTNIDEKEIDRIIKLRISPINVSVHTMNPKLRVKMMNNPNAGDSLRFLEKLSNAGIALNCQLVLCPGINDGKELEYSLERLKELGKGLESVACVPVGLSGHREGLYPLTPYTAAGAGAAIDIIESFGGQEIKKGGVRRFYPSDEFYLIAGRELPPYEFYEDFPQIENGVGMLRSLEEEVLFALEEGEEKVQSTCTAMITGTVVYPFMSKLLDEIRRKWDNIDINLVPVKNKFFGGSVDVTGLLTGSDIISALKGVKLGGKLLVPEVCLKANEDIFLDDISLLELSEQLGIKVRKVGSTGRELVDAIIEK